MKNYILYSLCMFALLSCQQEADEPFMGDPDKRLNEVLSGYKEKLTSSPYGWKAFLYPGEGGGFNFLMEFSTEGRVSMLADLNNETAVEPFESSYRMVATQRPALFFDTYSYIHMLSDPSPEVYGGVLGIGYISDFEFAFESEEGDTIKLKGIHHGSEMIMVRATQREYERYRGERLKTMMTEVGNYAKANPYLFFIAPDNKKTSVSVNPYIRSFTLVEEVNGEVEIHTSRFSFTTEGILLRDKLKFLDIEFNQVFADTASNQLYIKVGSNGRIDLKVLDAPVFPMHLMVGIEFLSIIMPPNPVETPGWSSDFQYKWITIDDYIDDNYGLRLSDIQMIFNVQEKMMDINIYVKNVSAGRSYRLRYPYTYNKTGETFTFTESTSEEPNFNAVFFKPIMDIILDEIGNHPYKMNYLPTDEGFYGQLRSQSNNRFYFAGRLR